MNDTMNSGFTFEELELQHTAELPGRDLLAALTIFGLPVAGVSGVDASISGPRFLA
jgi:hypothetical protein